MAKNLPFVEPPPAKSVQEWGSRTVDKTGAFFTETNEKYKVSEKTAQAAEATKQGFISLWGKAKQLVKKNPEQAAGGSATESAATEE